MSVLLDEFKQLAPDLALMTNALGLPELAAGIMLAEGLLTAFQAELSARGMSPHDAKQAIDTATQAAILAKFGGK